MKKIQSLQPIIDESSIITRYGDDLKDVDNKSTDNSVNDTKSEEVNED